MAGEITRRRNGKDSQYLPTWAYGETQDTAAQNLEMLESVRNVLIDIKNSQMLQCDVRSMIQSIQYNTEQTRIMLKRIDRRLAKVEATKLR
jgi:hypothetical protein